VLGTVCIRVDTLVQSRRSTQREREEKRYYKQRCDESPAAII
jgi:hypothetical protein